MSISTPCLFLIFLMAVLMIVKVVSPRKSIFNIPALSTTLLSNWVTSISESRAVDTGTSEVNSSGVMITPQACVPVFRSDPSSMMACFKTWARKSLPFLISFSSFTSSNAFSRVVPGLSGTSLARLLASESGSSITRAQSRMEDLAAMVP